jgi:hypothetical protein
MQLTEHFSDSELGVKGCVPRLLTNAAFLCDEILEPIRAMFGPVRVHDGYRDTAHNARVGGKQASYHLFDEGRAAADIDAAMIPITPLFDWLRLNSGLAFDKVILEKNSAGVPVCVHVQIDRLNPPRRQAYIGFTGASEDYTQVEVR